MTIMDDWALGALLRKAREDKNLGMVTAAKLAGVARQTLYNLESGKQPGRTGGQVDYTPSQAVIEKVADTLGVPRDEALAATPRYHAEPADRMVLAPVPTISVRQLSEMIDRMPQGHRDALAVAVERLSEPPELAAGYDVTAIDESGTEIPAEIMEMKITKSRVVITCERTDQDA